VRDLVWHLAVVAGAAAVIAVAMESRRVVIEVLGVPAPKGSGRAMLVRGRALHIASGSDVNQRRLHSWDTAVREAAASAVGRVTAPPFVGIPLHMTITFRMGRPAGHWGKRGLRPGAPAYPFSKPDLSKLVRATEDTLTGIVFDDDSRIVAAMVTKVWADPGCEGATITVEAKW
jgi:Holliday junction resolvase RusA-like endonuclease